MRGLELKGKTKWQEWSAQHQQRTRVLNFSLFLLLLVYGDGACASNRNCHGVGQCYTDSFSEALAGTCTHFIRGSNVQMDFVSICSGRVLVLLVLLVLFLFCSCSVLVLVFVLLLARPVVAEPVVVVAAAVVEGEAVVVVAEPSSPSSPSSPVVYAQKSFEMTVLHMPTH